MNFSTILWESRSVKPVRNFRTLKWKASLQKADTPTETFWTVRTNFRLKTFIEYLKMKFFYEGLSLKEQQLLFDSPGFFRDDIYLALLRAKTDGHSLEILESRLEKLQRLLGISPKWGKHLVDTYNGVLSYEILLQTRSVRKGKKYSGYVRNSSAVGSKRRSGGVKPEPEIFEWNTERTIDYYAYFTVGRLTLASGVNIILS